jgi:hypothetical protein
MALSINHKLEAENWAAWVKRSGQEKFEDPPATNRIEVIASRTGVPTVRVSSQGGRPIYLHSSVDPVREAKRVVETLAVESGTAFVVYGFGLGYLVEELQKANEKVSVFVVEPDLELFYEAMRTRDLREIISSERVHILVSDDLGELYTNFFQFFDGAYFDDLIPIGLPGHETVYPDFCKKARKLIRDVVSFKLVNLLTMIKLGPDMLKSSILNLVNYYTKPGLKTLYDSFENVPAIVVAAGPSLNKNIQLLHEAKGKAIILAVGTAMKALQKHGIEPDFIVTVDAGLPNYELFKGINTKNASLIAEMEANHLILENYQGPMFLAGSQPILRWFGDLVEDKGFTESGGSVANNAFVAAHKMGANPIIMVGQDLAFADDGHTHAAGTNYEDIVMTDIGNDKYFKVKANNGGQVYTDRIFYQFLKFFEIWIQKKPDREYINATEGGAFITGTKVMTLREVLDQFCTKPVDAQKVIQQAQNSFRVPDMGSFIEVLEQQRNKMNDTVKKARRAMKLLAQLEIACERKQTKKMQQYLESVRKIYKQFEEDEFISSLPEWFSAHELHGVMTRTYKASHTENDDFSAAITDYTTYYQKISDGAEKVKALIEICIEQAERRKGNAQ